MEFIGPLQKDRLDRINDAAFKDCHRVDAAIAYIHDPTTLIRKCFELKKPLHLRGRYDSSKPIGIAILEKFLACTSHDYRLTLVPDIFHPKVIWWHGYGVYIGSANLTNAAWFGNIEAGLFLDEDEIDEQEIRNDLIEFFEFVDQRARPLSKDIVAQIKELKPGDAWLQEDREYQQRFREERLIPFMQPLDLVNRPKADDRHEAAFLTEWNSTLKILGDLGKRLREYRPSWVPEDTPDGVHADQFLHGYYYNRVRGDHANSHPFMEFYETNRNNIEAALLVELEWWSIQKSAPDQEERMITQWAVELRDYLSPVRIKTLGKEDFIEVCRRVHAFRNHSQRIRYSAMGFSVKLPQMKEEERIEMVAAWLYDQRSGENKSPLQLIEWVLYGGAENQTPKRLFAADRDTMKRVPHMGISMLGEIVGWALPARYPPRNGRTSKALRALGYPVKVHGSQIE